jgi:GDP-L-fucose synthase
VNKNSKIYIAGHRGLVGSALVRHLETCGYQNIITRTSDELDLTNQLAVEEFFAANNPEYVFLAAAKVGGILANSTYPAEFIYENLAIGTNVVHAAYRYGVKKLLNLGSSCIYPRMAPQPMKEEYLLTSGRLEPTNEAYAIAKIAIIKLCRYCNQQYGTNFISLMPTNQYGENDNFNMETAHVLQAQLRRFHLAKLLQENDFDEVRRDIRRYPVGFGMDQEELATKGDDELEIILNKLGTYRDKVIVWGNEPIYREFMNSDDLADACIYFMENRNCSDIGEFVNITAGTDILLSDLSEILKDIIGFLGKIEHDMTKQTGTPRKLMDATKMQGLGWYPKIPLIDGIKKLYAWYTK